MKRYSFFYFLLLMIINSMPIIAQVNDGPFNVYTHCYRVRTGQEDETGTDEHGWRIGSQFDAPASGYYQNGIAWNCNCCGNVGTDAYMMNNTSTGGGCISNAPQYLDFQLQGWEDDGGNRYLYDDSDDNNCGMSTVRDNYSFRVNVPVTWINYGQHTVDCGGGCYFPCDNCNRDKYHAWYEAYYTVPNVTTISSNVSICQGQSTNISATPSGSGVTVYWYNNSGGAYVGTGNSLSVSPASTTTYNAYGQYAGTLSSCYRQVTVTVNPAVTANAGAAINSCLASVPTGISVTGASATNYTSLSWAYVASSGTGSITAGSTSLTPTFTPTTTSGSGTLTLTASGPCPSAVSSRTISWNVQAGAVAGANINSGCTGLAAITMTGASMSGTGTSVAGTWSGGGGSGNWAQNTGNPAAATFTPTTLSGSFTATLTTTITGGNCAGTATSTRTITWAGVTASAGGPYAGCQTAGITMSGGVAAGNFASVLWTEPSPDGSFTSGATTQNAAIFTPTTTSGSTTVTFTVTGNGGCAGTNPTSTASVTWTAGPSGGGGANISQCGNAAIPMTGASSGGGTANWTGGGGSGAWTQNAGNAGLAVFTPSVAAGSFTATLTITGTGACTGSTTTFTRTITWVAPPTAAAGGTINTCTGTTAIAMTGATSGGTNSGNTWSGSGGTWVQNANPALATFTPSTTSGTTTATLTVTGSGGCVGTNPTSTRTINWGTISLAPGANTTTCGLAAHPMTGSTATGNFSAVAWTGGGGSGSWTTTHPTDPAQWVFTPTVASGSFTATLTATGSAGCLGSNPTTTRTVAWSQAPAASAGAAIVACTGTGAITMTGATASGTYSGTPTWSGSGGTWVQNANPALATFTPSTTSGSITATLTVTGSGACAGNNPTSTRTITWSTNPVISSVVTTNVTDCNVVNGAIAITATGSGTLEYSIDNGANYFSYDDFLGLNDGVNYNVRVRDQLTGCTTIYGSNPVVLGGPTPVTATSIVVSANNICAGGTAGTITITGASGGGGGPYQYTLFGPASDRWVEFTGSPYIITGVGAGAYQVVLQDIFGCLSATTNLTVTEPAALTFTAITVTDIVGCGGSGTGAITVTVTGGTGTKNYYLNGVVNSPATSASWSGLTGGEYEITVTDGNGCSALAQATINAPWTVDAGNESAICSGGNTVLQGGIVGQFPTTCITSCTSSCGMVATCASQSANSSDERITNVSFNGASQNSGASFYTDYTGSLFTTVTRGSTYTLSVTLAVGGTYTEYFRAFIDWNRNGSFADAGENYLIFGGNTGPSTRTLNITVPAGATLGNTKMRIGIKYNGDFSYCDNYGTYGEVEDYRIDVNSVSTPTPTYTWSPGTNLSATNILQPTANPSSTITYTLTINDGCSCSQSGTTTVNVSAHAASSTLQQVSCNGANDACATINAINGVGPYLMKKGTTYKVYGGKMKPVTITNSNGTLTNMEVKIASVAYTAPMRSDFGDVRFFDANLNKLSYWIETFTLSGTATFWVKIPSLPNGNTTIYMAWGNGALSTESFGDNVFDFFDEFNYFNTSKWTRGTIAATGGTNWSHYAGKLVGGNTNRVQTSVPTFTGNYVSEGRVFESGAAVNGFTSLGFYGSAGNGHSILAHNGAAYARNDGAWESGAAFTSLNTWIRDYTRTIGASSYASRTGGSSWSQTSNNSGLSAERVRLGARGDDWNSDQNFSAQWDWLFVRTYAATEPTTVVGAVVNSDNVFCSLGPGATSVLVADMAGCQQTVNFTITEPTAITATATFTPVTCYAPLAGAIDLSPSGGTPAYSYNWAGPGGFSSSTQDPSVALPGVYSVSVADQNTCVANTTVTVTQLTPIESLFHTWKGTQDNLWQDYRNWDCGIVPTSTSRVIIPAAPVGGNLPDINAGINANVYDIEIRGNTVNLLELISTGTIQIHKP